MALFKASSLLAPLGIVILYFFTRLYNIMALPIFTDEAIYTRWAQIAEADANWRFISLTDGKQPSFIWLDLVFMKFTEDPLLAGRLVSVLAGFASLVGIYFLASEIFKKRKVGIIAALLYVIYPFSLVYDRMALYDSLVASCAIWALYFAVISVRRVRLDVAMIFGAVLGIGALTKSNAFLSIYLLPLTLFLFDHKQKDARSKFLKWIGMSLISIFIAYAIYSVLRLSPYFHIIDEKTETFVYPLGEWIKHPFEFFVGNLYGLTDWLISYFTIPMLILAVASIFPGGAKFLREKIFLLVWFFIPFIALALFGKVLYPRYILFMTMPLLVLSAFTFTYVWDKVSNRMLKIGIVAVSIAMFIRMDYFIINDFKQAPIVKADLNQYMNAWPAGGGANELVKLLDEESKKGKIYVATEGTFGSLPTYIVEIYLNENKNIDKRGIWPLPLEIPPDLLEKAKSMKVFFVLNSDKQVPPASWPLKEIVKYQKGTGEYYMKVYEVIPESD